MCGSTGVFICTVFVFSGFGFRSGSPLNPLYGLLRPYGTSESIESETIGSEALSVDPMISEASTDSVSNSVDETLAIGTLKLN